MTLNINHREYQELLEVADKFYDNAHYLNQQKSIIVEYDEICSATLIEQACELYLKAILSSYGIKDVEENIVTLFSYLPMHFRKKIIQSMLNDEDEIIFLNILEHATCTYAMKINENANLTFLNNLAHILNKLCYNL